MRTEQVLVQHAGLRVQQTRRRPAAVTERPGRVAQVVVVDAVGDLGPERGLADVGVDVDDEGIRQLARLLGGVRQDVAGIRSDGDLVQFADRRSGGVSARGVECRCHETSPGGLARQSVMLQSRRPDGQGERAAADTSRTSEPRTAISGGNLRLWMSVRGQDSATGPADALAFSSLDPRDKPTTMPVEMSPGSRARLGSEVVNVDPAHNVTLVLAGTLDDPTGSDQPLKYVSTRRCPGCTLPVIEGASRERRPELAASWNSRKTLHGHRPNGTRNLKLSVDRRRYAK